MEKLLENSLDDLQKLSNDPKLLAKLAEEHPEIFQELYNANSKLMHECHNVIKARRK